MNPPRIRFILDPQNYDKTCSKAKTLRISIFHIFFNFPYTMSP